MTTQIARNLLPKSTKHFIGGEYVPSASGKTYKLINPASGKEWIEISEGDVADVDRAVEAAEKALQVWSDMGYAGRQKALLRLADLWEKHASELAYLEAYTNGTPLGVQEIVISGLAHDIRYHAGLVDKNDGRVVSVDGPFHVYTRREPLGVCGIIGPWNLPLWCICVSAFPALAAGNALVVKPSEQTPLTTLRIAELMLEAGIPAGCFNVVCGHGQAGSAIASHMKIAKVAFTGSTDVGRKVMESAAKSNLKQVQLELGGKSPVVVFQDSDLDLAVEMAQFAVFNNNGQICTAGSRTYVHDSIYDEFVRKSAERARKLKVGDPLDKANSIGPLVDKRQYEKVLSYIGIGVKEGGKLLAGGGKLDQPEGTNASRDGFYVQPTVFAVGDRHDSTIAREEIFGPVQTIIRFKDMDQVGKWINDSQYGLAAAVFSKDIGKVFALANKVHAGTVWVNTYHYVFPQAPFGGYKQSGFGREGGKEGFDAWSHTKTVVIALPSQL